MKKAILYVRVSTDEQARHGYSLRDQEERLRMYCEKMDIQVSAIFKEDYSAKNFNRPEFNKLMQYARSNKTNLDLLLFLKWDRFSRNVMESYSYINKFMKMGIDLLAIEQPVDMRIPENKFMLSFFLTAPDVENERRSINVTQGMRKSRKEGRLGCTAPKGYSNKRDELNKPIIEPNEDAHFIIEAFNEVSKGIEPLDHIRKRLNGMGFNCSKSNFSKLIRNPVYMGKLKVKKFMDDPEEIVDGNHEPLVSSLLFHQVQDVINGKKRSRQQPKVHGKRFELPLRGFLFCHKCGQKLTGSGSKGNGGRYFYYHCNHCKQTRFRADEAENSLMKKLSSFKIQPEFASLFLKVFKDYTKQQEKSTTINKKSIQNKISTLQDRIIGLQDKFADDLISSVEYHEIKSRYELDIEQLNSQLNETMLQKKDMQEMMDQALGLMVNIDNHYVEASLEVKHQLIGSIFTGEVFFEENQVRTTEINSVLELVCCSSKAFSKNEKGQLANTQQLSSVVNPGGVEPPTF